MTDRPTASTITDDELDALYARLDLLERRDCGARPDGFVVFDTYVPGLAAITERPVLRQSPQSAAAAPRPDAPGTMPGARESAEHPLSGVEQRPGGEIGAHAGAEGVDPPAAPCTATNTRPWGNGPTINCTLPANHYDEDNEPTFNEDGTTITPGGWHHGLMDGLDLRWCDRAEGATPHTPAQPAPDQSECSDPAHNFFGRCNAPEKHAPPAGALRDTIAEAVHATSVCEVGDPVRCGGGCRDAADAVLPVVQAELARVPDLHADTERRLRADLAAEVRKREEAETTARTLGGLYESAEATVTRVHEYVQNLDQMAESTASADDRRLYRALAADLRKRLGYDTNDVPKEPTP
ncbi:hypothetical protein [Streptomyces aculeolatus]|uniref:hypothetical protein n=1 Tax=Streptomyces aculeolatus TaxID=270689 RepID=UPI001CED422B|nr:hypothetical protein [Streptomyces aculeolatus]